MPPPNVLFILSDDQRFDTIHALGQPHIHTPNLDDLASRGVAFSRNFCTTPICTPARAEILTGCNSFTNQVPWFGMPINPELTLLPQAFGAAGYHTIHVGKWHNDGHPRDRGYDVTRRVGYMDNLNDYSTFGHIMRFREGDTEVEGHTTELFTDAALEELAAAPGDRPWLCYLSYTAPHDPHDSPEPFASMYDPEAMPLLPNFMPEHPFDNGDMLIRDELLENWPREQAAMRRYRARYYGIIGHMDYHIGRLLGHLRLTGQLDNTVIVFTGDQGLAIGSHGLLGKESMYDHSLGSPLIIAAGARACQPADGRGLPAGGRSEALVHHVDLFPTLCELTGVPRPASAADGFSLVPLMRGEVARVREEVFCEFYSPEVHGGPMRHTQRAVRTERWKLTWFPQIGRYQLFDLRHDPHELVDLLVPWRTRQRGYLAEGLKLWQGEKWSPRDLRPVYTQAEIAEVAADLHRRLIAHMERNADPALAEQRPPSPV
ncbi:sulfatase-like hydrolase/transferase [bacterium]|nr:sulfatase-like hydrolase/transferase [bacterium]